MYNLIIIKKFLLQIYNINDKILIFLNMNYMRIIYEIITILHILCDVGERRRNFL